MKKLIIGVDEAGRGPLAGPVAVGVACVPASFDWGTLPGVNDSKQLTEKKRAELFLMTRELQRQGELSYAVAMVSAKVIDEIGIVPSIHRAMKRGLIRVTDPAIPLEEYMIKLDGGLAAPPEYVYQETIVKGDSKERVIGLASIMAKVTRDRYMERMHQKAGFEVYDFTTHKGYGTKKHRAAIAAYGLTQEHRRSFCKAFV